VKTPKPKTVKVDCDVCGLDWKQHKPDAKGKVTLDECVRLLKAELAKPCPSPFYQVGVNPYFGSASTSAH
jgi:hypothetical protein